MTHYEIINRNHGASFGQVEFASELDITCETLTAALSLFGIQSEVGHFEFVGPWPAESGDNILVTMKGQTNPRYLFRLLE